MRYWLSNIEPIYFCFSFHLSSDVLLPSSRNRRGKETKRKEIPLVVFSCCIECSRTLFKKSPRPPVCNKHGGQKEPFSSCDDQVPFRRSSATKSTLDQVHARRRFQATKCVSIEYFFFFLSCLLFSEIYVEPTLPSTESHSTEHVKQVKHVLLVAAENHCGWKKEKCLSEGERVCQNAVVKKKVTATCFANIFFVECVSARVSFLFSPFVTFFFSSFYSIIVGKTLLCHLLFEGVFHYVRKRSCFFFSTVFFFFFFLCLA